MSKKIKNQIKRTMPYFMILSLIMSSTVVGLIFNLNVGPRNLVNNMFRPEVRANTDTATTSVTVLNAPPIIDVQPSEVFASGAGSTSTTPVNIGEQIGFSVTAHDLEDNNYYILVCATGGTPTPGAAGATPSCNGGAGNLLCVSGKASSTAEATCTYSGVSGAPETKDWFTFVCDDHATQADCSAYSQGSAGGVDATSSPMYVNHAPAITANSTTVDNQQAGNNPFTFTATTTDTDLLGGLDVIQYDVCTTNSWATSTGCAATTICSATSTIVGGTAVVSCQATTTIPTVDQSYNYYGFAKDWHSLSASSGNGALRTYTVVNTAPVVSSVVLNSANPIVVAMKYSASSSVSVTATISDDNSCADAITATSSVYLSNVAGLEGCSANTDNCYQITSANCSVTGGSCTGVADYSANYTCTVELAFNSIPTDDSASNSNEPNHWLAGMRAFDGSSATHVATSTATSTDIGTLMAMAVTELNISYGTIKGGQNSGANHATTTVINYGNSPLNSDISGTDMGTIGVANQKYDRNSANAYGVMANTLAAAPATLVLVAPKPTSGSPDVSDAVYWGINIPGGTLSGNYSGTNSFVSTLNSSVPW